MSDAPNEALNPYPGEVWTRFVTPGHAGLPDGADVIVAEVKTPAADAVLQVGVRCTDGAVSEAGFLAHGCPEVIATGQIICEKLTGNELKSMDIESMAEIETRFGLTPEKRYCRLLAEDALRVLQARLPEISA